MIRLDFATIVLVVSIAPPLISIILAALKYVWAYDVDPAVIIAPLAVLGAMAVPFGVIAFISMRFAGG